MHDLGRINLLVGTNNSGKTSVLEALELLTSRSDTTSLWSAMRRRGESIWDTDRHREHEADVVHLFHLHDFDIGSSFSIFGSVTDGEESVEARIEERLAEKESSPSLLEADDGDDYAEAPLLVLDWGGPHGSTKERMPLTSRGGLPSGLVARRSRLRRSDRRVQYITTAAMSVDDVVAAFDQIVLTPEEDLLIDALRTIEPGIERIASVATDSRRLNFGRGGIVVKYKGNDCP